MRASFGNQSLALLRGGVIQEQGVKQQFHLGMDFYSLSHGYA